MLRNKATGEIQTSTDLGRAISTGWWADVGQCKPPQLRGLAARAPFFHDGSAESLHDVVPFDKECFHIALEVDEEATLVRFLEVFSALSEARRTGWGAPGKRVAFIIVEARLCACDWL